MPTKHAYLLSPVQNPGRSATMSLTLEADITFHNCETKVEVQYFPDREIITPKNFSNWLKAISNEKYITLEDISSKMIHDFYDSTLPLHVSFRLKTLRKEMVNHSVVLTKSQPEYELPEEILKVCSG